MEYGMRQPQVQQAHMNGQNKIKSKKGNNGVEPTTNDNATQYFN